MTEVGMIWQELRAESHLESGWYARRIHPDAAADIHAAIRHPNGTPALLMEVNTMAVPTNVDYPSAVGFEVFPQSVIHGPGGRVRLCLVLSDVVYQEVFEVLCQDVADAVTAAGSDMEGIRLFFERLRVWQYFMRQYGAQGLGVEAQIGLFAELHFLQQELLARIPVFEAVESWEGPEGGIQDFQLAQCAVEVKGSILSPPDRIEISTLAQLDETRVGRLLLCHVSLGAGNQAGRSLPEIIRDIGAILHAADMSSAILFKEKLFGAGYLDIHAARYADRRYAVRQLRFFRVEDNFPRIRACEVRPGVVSGSYSIAFVACLPFEVDAATARALMFGG